MVQLLFAVIEIHFLTFWRTPKHFFKLNDDCVYKDYSKNYYVSYVISKWLEFTSSFSASVEISVVVVVVVVVDFIKLLAAVHECRQVINTEREKNKFNIIDNLIVIDDSPQRSILILFICCKILAFPFNSIYWLSPFPFLFFKEIQKFCFIKDYLI